MCHTIIMYAFQDRIALIGLRIGSYTQWQRTSGCPDYEVWRLQRSVSAW